MTPARYRPAAVELPCCSCRSTVDVRNVAFWVGSRAMFVDRPLCASCRPDPGTFMEFRDWLDWAWENR